MPTGGGNAASLAAQQQKERALALAQGKAAIDQQFAGFTPEFYNQKKQDYINYAMPQLGQQFRTQQNEAQYALANKGQTRSSQAEALNRTLGQSLAQNQQTIANTGQAQANQLRQNVEGQRANLYGILSSSQDPSMAATGALAAAQNYTTPSAFVPIGQMFADWTQNNLASKNATTFQTATDNLNRPYTPNFAPLPK